jgi:head-tail adaptor
MIFRGQDTVLVDIEKPQTVKQASGDVVTSWILFYKCYANKRFKRGNERFQNLQKDANEQIEWRVRFFDGITELMRINHDGFFYDITAIDNKQRDGFMTIFTSAFPTREQSNRIGAGQ